MEKINKEEYLKKWSEKLSIPVEHINEEFSNLLEDEKTVHSSLSEEDQIQRALQRLSLTYKKQLRSPAIGFEGILIGVGDCIDMVAKQRRTAIESYKLDPQGAITQGIVNEEGEPLDTRQIWASGKVNSGYGKPLPEHNYSRVVYGVAIKSNSKGEKPKPFVLTINGNNALKEDMPLFQPVRFMAIEKTFVDNSTDSYIMNASTFTKFVVDKTLQLPKVEDIISMVYSIVPLNKLNQYHESQKDNYNRLVITEGDVSSLNLEPTAFGSRVMIIEDTSNMEDLESKGTTCWLPLRFNIDFSEGSKVLVVGRTAQGKKKNSEGMITDEPGDVTINTFGVYALPEYKINLPEEVKKLSEDSLSLD
jgi:hypothetical protein